MTLFAERARDKTNHFAYDFACENVAHGNGKFIVDALV